MQLTELPYGLPGRAFRSSMPFKIGDEQGDTFRHYQDKQIQAVVVLAPDEECQRKTGRSLRQFYREQGLKVIELPIEDFRVPEIEALRQAVRAAYEELQAGHNLAIHCYAGVGRTGLFAACLAGKVQEFSAQEAIAWVRAIIPGAVETHEQVEIVRQFCEG